MQCPVCGLGELVTDRRPMPYGHQGQEMVIPAVRGDYCPACGDCLLDMGEGERVNNAMRAFIASIAAKRRHQG